MKKIPLSIARPDLTAQFHPNKNIDISPEVISFQHKGQVWWLCEKGHEWKEKVSNRVRQKTVNCKICESLAYAHPELAKELHPTFNNDLKADDIAPGSHQKVWWLCQQGHEYNATVKNRAVNRSGCPYCTGRKITSDKSLAVSHPELAKILHPTKNNDITADKITSNYQKQVWWMCELGHEWQETVLNCSRQSEIICKGCRSIGYLRPELLEEWHPSNQLSVYETAANCNEKVLWRCKVCKHEWWSNVANRFRGSGCPGCSGADATPNTSVAALYPEVAKEWDYVSNSKTPADYTIGSMEEVFWICSNGHCYKESIYDRTTRNRGCPTCKTVAYLCPHLIDEWSSQNSISPYEEFAGSGKEVSWRCKSCNHTWNAKILDRYHGHGCPNCNSGWTIDKIRRFVTSLLPYLHTLSQAGLHLLLQQRGLLTIAKDAKGHSFIQALKTGRFPTEELKKFTEGQPSLVDKFIADPMMSLDQESNFDSINNGSSKDEKINPRSGLPMVETKDALSTLDSKLFSNQDSEVVDFFIKEAVDRIWQHAYSDESVALQQLEEYNSDGTYPQEVRRLFLADYQAAKDLPIPNGYSSPHLPNLMQRYTAHLVSKHKRLGNWSGTGAGKTLSAVLASRVISANLTIICCPNNVIDNWERTILGTYPNSVVFSKDTKITILPNKHFYLILNYEFFQQSRSESKLKAFVENQKIDFIIIDEIHYSKQRAFDNISIRKRVISALLSEAAAKNSNLHVLGMSATPVINNLFEGKTLIELITGVLHDDLKTTPSTGNCIALYQKLVSTGIRWRPQYHHKIVEKTIEVDCSSYLDEIKNVSLYGSMVDLEAVLTKAKLSTIIENIKPKTIVYTHYLKDIVNSLREVIELQGWKTAVFTGDDKSGLDEFVKFDADVLIASSCLGTGIDGLQHVCDRIIINTLPWTSAEFEQLKGRIYRQGQKSDLLDIIVPLTYAIVNGARWSWCESRWKRILFKKSIADAAVDGVLPEGQLRTPAQAYQDAMSWLRRLEEGKLHEIQRHKINLKLLKESVQIVET